MKNEDLDYRYFFPEVLQAVAGEDFTVYAYMNDGGMRLYDVKPLIQKGGIYKKIADKDVFRETLTVMNHSIAWDLAGNRDEYNCIDIDPFDVFESPIVKDIPELEK